MVIVDREIMLRMALGWQDYDVNNINPASVDLRISLRDEWALAPGGSDLFSTVEWVDLGPFGTLPAVAGLLTLKSSAFRLGLALAAPGWVDPGFVGNLTVRLINTTNLDITIRPDQKLLQLVQYRLYDNPNKLYEGHYQHSRGVVENQDDGLG